MIKTTMRSYCKGCSKPVQLMSEDIYEKIKYEINGLVMNAKTVQYYCGECHVFIRDIKVEK